MTRSPINIKRRDFVKRGALWVAAAPALLLARKLSATNNVGFQMAAAKKKAAGGATYDFTETFDPTGYSQSGWTEDLTSTGVINEDYTATILDGAQSLQTNHATGPTYLYRTVSGSSISVYFQWQGITESTFTPIFTLNQTNYYDQDVRISIGGANTLRLIVNGVQIGSDVSVTFGNKYHIWLDWTSDTVCDLFVSTTGTKPAANCSATAAEVPAWTLTRLTFRSGIGGSQIFDRCVIHSSAIGNDP